MNEQAMAEKENWTVETLREYIISLIKANDLRYSQRFNATEEATDKAFSAQKALVDAVLTSAEKAITKAEIASDKRFESVNEFRGTLADQQRNLLPRTEYVIQHQALVDRITALEERTNAKIDQLKGDLNSRQVWLFVTLISFLTLILLAFISAIALHLIR